MSEYNPCWLSHLCFIAMVKCRVLNKCNKIAVTLRTDVSRSFMIIYKKKCCSYRLTKTNWTCLVKLHIISWSEFTDVQNYNFLDKNKVQICLSLLTYDWNLIKTLMYLWHCTSSQQRLWNFETQIIVLFPGVDWRSTMMTCLRRASSSHSTTRRGPHYYELLSGT